MVRPCRRLRNHSPELPPSNRAAAPLPLVCNGAASSPTESVVAQLTARSRSSVADVGRIAGPDDVAGWDCSGSDCDSPLESPCRSLRVTALQEQLCAADLVGSSHEPVGYLDVSARTRETRTSLPPTLAREPSTGWTWRLSCVQLEMVTGESYVNTVAAQYVPAPRTAAAGNVVTQAVAMFPATAQRTALVRLVDPAPMIADEMT